MSVDTDIIKRRYDRLAPFFDWMEGAMEKLVFKDLRNSLWKNVIGERILEVGVGTGKNFPYYPVNRTLSAVDFSPGMIKQAQKKRKKMKLDIELVVMDVEALEYPDNHFDCVVGTFLFCSVPDPAKGLLELKRVCKPGGTVILLEHVLSTHKFLAALMNLVNPIIVHLFGANINRETVKTVQATGFQTVEILEESSHLVKLIKAVK